MNLRMGSQTFVDVGVPLLWGTRAVLQDSEGRISVIDLAPDKATLEILGDEPAPGAEYVPVAGGFQILDHGKALYSYRPSEKRLSDLDSKLPDCEIRPWEIRVGTNVFSSNTIAGFEVGIAVSEKGIAIGSALPPNLAKLVM